MLANSVPGEESLLGSQMAPLLLCPYVEGMDIGRKGRKKGEGKEGGIDGGRQGGRKGEREEKREKAREREKLFSYKGTHPIRGTQP